MRSVDRGLALAVVLIGVPLACADARGSMLLQPAQGASGTTLDLSTIPDPAALEQRLRGLLRAGSREPGFTLANGQARRGNFSVGPSETVTGDLLVLEGNADLFGKVTGNVVALDGDIVLHAGAVVTGDAVAIGGSIRERGGMVRGEQRSLGAAPTPARGGTPGVSSALTRLAGLAGVLLTLALLGFGLVLFAGPNLDLVSDTVTHSVLRSFATGLLAQVVAIPTFGMLVTGLVLSVVGILLVPFVVIVVPLLLVAAILTGLLAVAHAMGETHTKRKMAAGVRVGSANSYRYLAVGLAGIGALWLAWIGLGWVPVAGTLMFVAAFLATWILMTIGFGACLLSRAGITPAFAGRYLPPEAMTDEYLWATPQFGVTAVKRPEAGTTPRPRR